MSDREAMLSEQGAKTCTFCSRSQSLTEFPKDKRTSDGRGSWCKGCHRAYVKAAYTLRERHRDEFDELWREGVASGR